MTLVPGILGERDTPAFFMISRFRFIVTAVFIGHLFPLPLFATDQLSCPPVLNSTKDDVTICAIKQEKDGSIFKMHVRGKIDYRDLTLLADEATYNSDTGDVTLDGHVVLDGGANDEHIKASHGTYNIRSEVGEFYDVIGTINSHPHPHPLLLMSSNPFAFSGKVVDKVGPDHYVVHDGIITSCEMPNPKWQFNMHRASVTVGGNALIYFSNFRTWHVPVFYFPFATHPVGQVRKSGLLTPNLGLSNTKGTIVGDAFYWAINRSMDLVAGAEDFTRRGWAQHGEFRAIPSDKSYVDMTYFGVIDRGIGTPKVKEGGEDVRFTGEDHFGGFRAVAKVEYLSSLLFRAAFSQFYNLAVPSEVKSSGFVSKNTDGYSYNAFLERYQSFQSLSQGDVITIRHTPSFDFSSVDHNLGSSSFYWSVDTAIDGLSRSTPTFSTAPVVGRFDINPRVDLPLLFHGWSLRPELGVDYTLYSQQLALVLGKGVASDDPINRRAIKTAVELRPPVLERIFDREIFGHKLKHVIEPRVIYRRADGIDNFAKLLRFDERDILSDTNDVEYAVVNRLYTKGHASNTDCSTAAKANLPFLIPPTPSELGLPPWEQDDLQQSPQIDCTAASRARELISWELAQKYFVDTSFGGALVVGSRNVFTSTEELTPFAFLISPRHLSPLISRLHVLPSSAVDAEWDLDYDFNGGRVDASTALLNYHIGQFTFGGGDAFLNLPGESLVSNNTTGVLRFNQFRTLLQYGQSTKRGFSAAATFGVDANSGVLQYSVVQTTYNWDCCGISIEYRRIALGSIRNENEYRFSYSLANIGSFGNLLKRERLY